MNAQWHPTTTWDRGAAARFKRFLSQARDKGHPLLTQAAAIAVSHPRVSLKLLDQLFLLPDGANRSAAHVTRAHAYLTLGHLGDAVLSFESALREAADQPYPSSFTYAHVEFPYLIAVRSMTDRYARARELLDQYAHMPLFPVGYFCRHAAYSMLHAACGESAAAKHHAALALRAAALDEPQVCSYTAVRFSGHKGHDVLKLLGRYRDA
jgi:hypothetical protein